MKYYENNEFVSSNTDHITNDPGTEEWIVNVKWLTNSFKLAICPGSNSTSMFIYN